MTMAEPEQLTLRSTGCCSHDCCRGVTVGRSAQAEPAVDAAFAPVIDAPVFLLHFESPATQIPELQSTRAPPQSPIA